MSTKPARSAPGAKSATAPGPEPASARAAKAAAARKRKAAEDDIFALIGKSENIEEAADAMKAMAHPMRLKILCLLGSGEMAVQEIVEAVGTTQSNISQHLGILKDRGLINARNDGKRVMYQIQDARILKMISLTRNIFCSF
jgi:DNA-binding transcriptional ArsR family regulator